MKYFLYTIVIIGGFVLLISLPTNIFASDIGGYMKNNPVIITQNIIVLTGGSNNNAISLRSENGCNEDENIANTGSVSVTIDCTIYDSILRTDLLLEDKERVHDMIISMRKEVEVLKQKMLRARDNNERIEPIKNKIRYQKEVFFNEMKVFIQKDDMLKFKKIIQEDSDATENFLLSFTRIGEPPLRLRQQIAMIIEKIEIAKKESKLIMLVSKLQDIIATTKISDKKKKFLSQIQEAIQDELDSLIEINAVADTIIDSPDVIPPTADAEITTNVSTGSSEK